MLELLKAIGGMFFLMVLWLGVQSMVRKRGQYRPDQDVLEDRVHGCGGHCHGSGQCSAEASHAGGAH